MRVPKVVLSGLVAALLLIAGCIGDDGQESQSGPPDGEAEFDDETGAIEGVVLDGEGLPLPGAEVGLREADLITRADESGRFTFSHVEPGTFTLLAQALGHEPASQRLEVLQGQVTQVEVLLQAIAVTEPYSTQIRQSGLFGCGASWSPPVGGITGIAACGVLSLVLNLTQYDKFLLEWDVAEDVPLWNGSVYEMQWESNQVAGRGLTMIWEVCSNDAETRFARDEGVSPLRSYRTAEHVQAVIHNGTSNEDACEDAAELCNEDGCQFISRVFSTPQTTGAAADVGVTFQQRFEQVHTAFFVEPGPEDYTAFQDA